MRSHKAFTNLTRYRKRINTLYFSAETQDIWAYTARTVQKKKRDTAMKPKKTKEYLWASIVTDIERKIIKQEYKTWDVVPSLNELAKMYNSSKVTAQRVLNDLSERGIIVKEVGRGSYVKKDTSLRKKLVAKQKRELLYHIEAIQKISTTLDMTNEEILELIVKQG